MKLSPVRLHTIRVLGAAILIVSVLVGLAGGSRSAQASYPGHNGRLAFGMVLDGNPEIVTVNSDGHALHRLTNNPAFDACAAYSPDGKSIAFCSDRTGAFEIWMMKQNGTKQRQVTFTGGFCLFPDVSPDGTRISVVVPEEDSETRAKRGLDLVLNWRSMLQPSSN